MAELRVLIAGAVVLLGVAFFAGWTVWVLRSGERRSTILWTITFSINALVALFDLASSIPVDGLSGTHVELSRFLGWSAALITIRRVARLDRPQPVGSAHR